MGPASWKNASTLIILARNRLTQANNKNCQLNQNNKQLVPDYKCMLLKRSATSKFFAKAFVFPGGAIEKADFSSSWLDYFTERGFGREKLVSEFVYSQQTKIPLYGDALIYPDCIPEVGYRISAIRETFEETGVLICKPIGNDNKSLVKIDNLSEWQDRVHRDPEQFLLLCQKYNLYPDIWSLYEWSNWLTPVHIGTKRYDTIFYICVVDEVPEVRIDGKEITELRWIDPVSAIRDHVQGHIWLAPPQVYELCRLANFTGAEDLKLFAKERQSGGIEQWLPVGLKTKNGIISVLPGDSLYPGSNGQPGKTMEDGELCFDNSGTFKNRMFFVSPSVSRIGCNINDPHRHKQPRNLIDEITEAINKSSL